MSLITLEILDSPDFEVVLFITEYKKNTQTAQHIIEIKSIHRVFSILIS